VRCGNEVQRRAAKVRISGVKAEAYERGPVTKHRVESRESRMEHGTEAIEPWAEENEARDRLSHGTEENEPCHQRRHHPRVERT